MPAQRVTALGLAIPLGRYAGIRVLAHWSVALMGLLQAEVLAGWVLPHTDPGRTGTVYWVSAAVISVVILATLLAHEVVRCAVARHYGVPVEHVTLWILGGFTELDREPASPRTDALIALAGPVTSLLLAGLFAAGRASLGGTGLVGTSLAWLALINVLFAVFNLLPGSPADGGRLLRAVLWAGYRDRARATAASLRTGRVLGIVFIAVGLAGLLLGSLVGVWLAVGGAFLLGGVGIQGLRDAR